jgi:hypothetical protein
MDAGTGTVGAHDHQVYVNPQLSNGNADFPYLLTGIYLFPGMAIILQVPGMGIISDGSYPKMQYLLKKFPFLMM